MIRRRNIRIRSRMNNASEVEKTNASEVEKTNASEVEKTYVEI